MRSNQALRYSLIGVLAVSILFTASLLIGMSDITLTDVLGMLFNYDGSKQHQILYTIRIPRALLCMFVGASMAVSGLVMQGLTKNPLASPQVLGVNAGATLAIIVVIVFFPGVGYQSRIIAAFIGAGVIGSLVQVIGFTKRLTPIKLSLVGISVQLFLSAITKFIMIFNESKTEQLYFWTVGGVHHATLKHIAIITPWFIIGIVLALLNSNAMNTLKMGEKLAVSLGVNLQITKVVGSFVVIILAGSSIAITGPISFIGLITPHLVAKFKINHFRTNLVLCSVYGAALLLLSDIISRTLNYPYESPVGIVTSGIGALFYFLFVFREMKRGQLDEK